MSHAAKHLPKSKKVAAALQEEFMRALSIHYPTPSDPLYDVVAEVEAAGDKFSVTVRPSQQEDWDWDRSELFDRARENAQDVATVFRTKIGAEEAIDLSLGEWVAKLNAYFVSNNADVISNPLLTTQRGQAHA